MLQLKRKSTWLILGLIVQGIALICMILIVIQTTSKSDLINNTFLGNLMSVYRVLDKLPDSFYRGVKPLEPLPVYQLKISQKNMQKIAENIPYEKGELTDEDETWVKADFFADGKKYDVKVRIRGDSTVHWVDKKKSWRIKFDKDNLFQGIRQLNLIIPEDRGWTAEPMAQYRVKKFGMIETPMRYVQVYLNGSGPMVYLEIEHWTKEMLEKQGLSGDADFYKTSFGAPVFENVAYWEKYETSPVRPLDSLEEMEMLRILASPGARYSPDFEDRVRSLFIEEELLAWYTNIMLAGSYHNEGDNLRFYFDTTIGKLRPIPWDIHLFTPSPFLITQINGFLQELFRIPKWYLAGQKMLYTYLEENAEVDIQQTAALRQSVERAIYRDRYKLMSNRLAKQGLDTFQSLIEENISFIQQEFKDVSALVAQRIATEAERSNGVMMTIDATVLGVTPISLSVIHVPVGLQDSFNRGQITLWRDDGSGVFDTQDTNIPLSLHEEEGKRIQLATDSTQNRIFPSFLFCDKNPQECPLTAERFFLRTSNPTVQLASDDLPIKLTMRNAVTEKKVEVQTVIIDDRTFERMEEISLNRSTFLARNPSFQSVGENGVQLSGTHVFRKSVIVPNTVELSIAPGTIIRMGSGISLYSYAPVSIVGTATRPIKVLGETTAPWGVFAVIDTAKESTVTWAEFSGGKEAYLNGTFFSGMLAFHSSPVAISDSQFRNAHGDDALNIKRIPANLERLQFENNKFDALDIDNAPSGFVRDSIFTVTSNKDNAGGDGIDLSWSSIAITDVLISGSIDKCMSVGERSNIVVENVSVKNCGIGIAAKDGSIITVNNSEIRDNTIGISAYIKKPFFPAPTIEITNTTLNGNTEDVQQLNDAIISITR